MKLSRRSKYSGNQLWILTVTFLAVLCIGCVMYVAKTDHHMNQMQSQLLAMEATLNQKIIRERNRVKRSMTKSAQKKRSTRAVGDDETEVPVPSSVVPGVTYKRWGRSNCPKGSQIVYHGLAAGSHYTYQGGSSETLCLDSNITYTPGRYVDGGQGISHIYGVQFQDSNWINPLFDLSLIEGNQLQFNSVPCAVCLAKAKISQLMISSQETCPEGWNKEYAGYIMTSSHGDSHAASPLCVDEQPQVVPGTDGDQKGNLLYMAETQCASLLCEPFVANREIRCVVCTL